MDMSLVRSPGCRSVQSSRNGSPSASRKGYTSRVVQLVSMPGKKAAPTQASSAARSSPAGLITVSGGGGDPLQSSVKVLAAHFCMLSYCVLVRDAFTPLVKSKASDQIRSKSEKLLTRFAGRLGSRSFLTMAGRAEEGGGKVFEMR